MAEDPTGRAGVPAGSGRGATGASTRGTDGDLQFRDPKAADRLADEIATRMDEIGRPVSVIHVCGSHERSIAKFGIRSVLPDDLSVRMGPGCPVCVTDTTEVDEAVALAEAGRVVATYGDMLRVPGSEGSLADARDAGADVEVVYSAAEAVALAHKRPTREVVFFATGFETTAAPTAAVLRSDPPSNFSVLSAHKYVPPAMELVAELPGTEVDGFLAAGHAATVTGYGVLEEFVARHELPVVVGGFEPLDVLLGLERLLALVRAGDAGLENGYPRCVDEEGNRAALEALWDVFETTAGEWRGIAEVPDSNLVLSDEYAAYDARERFDVRTPDRATSRTGECICGDLMAGRAVPEECPLFGEACTPENPVGACMVSSEGPCRIRHEYGGRPDL